MDKLRQTLLSISLEEATFAKRGFQETNAKTQQHLETIGKTFLQGYQTAIAFNDPSGVIAQINQIEAEYRGFAFEGAAMGLALLDRLTPWNSRRIEQYLIDEGQNHIYMTYVGIGWLLARLPGGIQSYLTELEKAQVRSLGNWDICPTSPHSLTPSHPHSLLGWLSIDGYGFHQGYFHWRDYIQGIKPPKNLSGYSCRVFDQGLGRSLWFVKGADLNAIQQAIAQFQPHRRADLWSGIGLACGYAGGMENHAIASLKEAAKPYYPELAQGVAFAAKTRIRAGNLTEHTEIAAQILCGMSAQQAADITDDTLTGLSYGETVPVYEQWRQGIQKHFI
ncbi:hypothetical protein AsFPU1_1669 [Aphanothece sacrum FPU1]|uniref:DUF1702 family protein n=1 Tax=Aphanothece sacrum FPU1 TaxID=1920663 RepID=A0A401IG63_APHSA|nr:hypothetical protein AsFPU1_1669 [Aphanothece sacrum FPU1]GBF83673.1 hypothetical protein AsFPU3_0716 [Aphanothece sacrum FPU3]